MNIEIPTNLEASIQNYATAHDFNLEEACNWLLKRGLAVYRCEQTSEKIPPELQGLIVSDYHTVSGWARFKGTRMPLQVLVDNLMAGMTPEEFLDSYRTDISLEDIGKVQTWLKTLPPWDPEDRENIPEPYRFMIQQEGP